jgi:hypothetical protein
MSATLVAWVNPATLLDNTDQDNAELLARIVEEITAKYGAVIIARIGVTADEEDDGTLVVEDTDDLLATSAP